MQTIHHIDLLRETLSPLRDQHIALVPTMGNLHSGHISLVEHAKQHADIVITSIFVNPLQFGANEDLDAYPKTLSEDQAKLNDAGNDIVFAPSVSEMYPRGQEQHTQVIVPGITQHHCGSSRPGHFDGVSTVVHKLFNIVQPHIAVFGQKDFQQLQVIRKMVHDLSIPTHIVGVATARAADGLALSSRNGYLTAPERRIAPLLRRLILETKASILTTGIRRQEQEKKAVIQLDEAGFGRDYFTICNANTLEPACEDCKDIVILAAAQLGKTRLIDNLHFQL